MSRFAILALMLVLAIIIVGAGFGWFIYTKLFDSPGSAIEINPQTASSVKIIQVQKEEDLNSQSAFEKLP